MLSQHALQVVSQHALQGGLVTGGAWWRPPPPGRLLLQAVRILLECILVDLVSERQWQIQDFPEVGVPTLGGGVPTYDFAKFSPKLHEIE